MRSSVRMLLLSLLALCLALPMAGGFGVGTGAEAASRPCPTQVVQEACVLDQSADAIVQRGTAANDAPCLGKAIGVPSVTLSAPADCDTLAFAAASVFWSGWTPPTLARPPRS